MNRPPTAPAGARPEPLPRPAPPPAVPADRSVAGEEDPGAALDQAEVPTPTPGPAPRPARGTTRG